MASEDEREILKAREFFHEQGLLPPIPERYGDDEQASDVVWRRLFGAPRRPRAPYWRRSFVLAAAAVAVVMVGGGLLAVMRSAPAAAATPTMLTFSVGSVTGIDNAPPAAAALAAAAHSVAALPTTPHDARQVQYLLTYGWLPKVDIDSPDAARTSVYPTVTRWWLAPDGTVRLDESRSAPLNRDGRIDRDSPTSNSSVSETNPTGTINAALAASLPTNLPDLRAALMATQAGLPCDASTYWQARCITSAVEMIYQQFVVPPDLAAAMWNVLADEGALRSLGTTTDRLGRAARAIALPPEPDQQAQVCTVLLLSEKTGQYLGTETVTLHDQALDITEPTVTGFSALSTADWVTTLGSIR